MDEKVLLLVQNPGSEGQSELRPHNDNDYGNGYGRRLGVFAEMTYISAASKRASDRPRSSSAIASLRAACNYKQNICNNRLSDD